MEIITMCRLNKSYNSSAQDRNSEHELHNLTAALQFYMTTQINNLATLCLQVYHGSFDDFKNSYQN